MSDTNRPNGFYSTDGIFARGMRDLQPWVSLTCWAHKGVQVTDGQVELVYAPGAQRADGTIEPGPCEFAPVLEGDDLQRETALQVVAPTIEAPILTEAERPACDRLFPDPDYPVGVPVPAPQGSDLGAMTRPELMILYKEVFGKGPKGLRNHQMVEAIQAQRCA